MDVGSRWSNKSGPTSQGGNKKDEQKPKKGDGFIRRVMAYMEKESCVIDGQWIPQRFLYTCAWLLRVAGWAYPVPSAVSLGPSFRCCLGLVGPRLSMSVASLCLGSGMLLGGLGIDCRSLPMLNTGFGVLVSTGIGLAYGPSILMLMAWFPDKRPLVFGSAITGFASGCFVSWLMMETLTDKFSKMPTYLGAMDQVSTSIQEGTMFAETESGLVEVVSVSMEELARLPYDLAEGLYVVGTGSTGAAAAIGVSGVIFGGIMPASSLEIKVPHRCYWVPGHMGAKFPEIYRGVRDVVIFSVFVTLDHLF